MIIVRIMCVCVYVCLTDFFKKGIVLIKNILDSEILMKNVCPQVGGVYIVKLTVNLF